MPDFFPEGFVTNTEIALWDKYYRQRAKKK